MSVTSTPARLRLAGVATAALTLAALAGTAPAAAQNPQNFPTGSIFWQPPTPPSSPKVHPYVPPNPMGRSSISTGSQHASEEQFAYSGSSLPPAPAAVPAPLFGFTTDCNAVSGGTASGRTSTTTALDCVPSPGAARNVR
jgi:hypothetical protein